MTSSPSRIHQISDQFVEDACRLDPIIATFVGVAGHDSEVTDFSPDGVAARGEAAKAALVAMSSENPANESETVAKAVFTERVGCLTDLYESGLLQADLNVVSSPVQFARMAFDLMPTDTEADWVTVSRRLARVPEMLDSIRAGLAHSADLGRVAAVRQVTKVADQCQTWAGGTGEPAFFATLVAGAGDDLPESLRTDLVRHATAASAAFSRLAGFLRGELAARAPRKDAVGARDYGIWSRYFTGARLDLAEAYQWGWEEFARIETEMRQVASRIAPGATLAEAAAVLDADPRYLVHGKDALRDWMQELSDAAVRELGATHFDIPAPIQRLDCRIAPPGGGAGAYYVGPSDDFTRAGAMWWSVVPGQTVFPTWREVSTVYHEGVPGHHLQIATAVHQSESLNRYQRLLSDASGYSEGWALYAERLMRELGYLSDDGNLLGMLDAHLFRAARVIVDIGMHLELEIPAGTGFHEGERWTPELGLEFMLTRTITSPDHVRDEIDRYLGWPGQAPSYKIGERLWLAARDEAKQRAAAAFDLKAFHMRALRMGSMGLDTLREVLAQF